MVTFNYKEIEWLLNNEKDVSNWVKAIAKEYGFKIRELNYIFCSDEYLLELNKKHLKHDFYTDILTFDNSDGQKKELYGDIYISIERVKDNSEVYATPFFEELHRVMAHGILHLIGFDDHEAGDKENMTEKEDEALALRTFLE